jgi:hypothetical protein
VVVKKELREIPEEMYLIQSCINSEFFNFSKDSERYGSKKDEETVYQILRDNYSKFNVCNEKWNGKTDKPSIIIPKERCWYDFRLKTEKCYDFKNGEFDYYTNIKSSSCVNKDNIVCMTGYIWALFGKEIKSKNIWYQYNEFIRLYDSDFRFCHLSVNSNYHMRGVVGSCRKGVSAQICCQKVRHFHKGGVLTVNVVVDNQLVGSLYSAV